MARKTSEKPTKPRIAGITWETDLVWKLIEQMEKDENYRVLFGKKDSSENTSGETKVTVYNRIAEAVLPELYQQDGNTVRDRVKSKIESLTKTYRKHASRLRQTGEGVKDDDGTEEALSFYIMGDGPCVETPPHAVNIWKQIEKEFVFFPSLHRIFASRPNVTPIVVTTALGPQGPKTVWFQPPDDNGNSDPRLRPTAPDSQPSRKRSFGDDAAGMVNANPSSSPRSPAVETPAARRGPKTSSASRDALEYSKKSVAKLPKKKSFSETLIEIQRQNINAQKSQNQMRINLELRKQIVAEFSSGLWTAEQAQEKIAALDNQASPPAKRSKTARDFSPDWNSDFDRVTDEEEL